MSGVFAGVPLLCLFAVGNHFVSYFINATVDCIGNYTQQKYAYFLRTKLYAHLTRVKFPVLEKRKTGDMQSVMRNDTERGGAVFHYLFRWQTHIAMIAFCMYYLIGIHAILTGIVFGVTLIFSLVSQGLLRAVRHNQTASRKSLGRLSHMIVSFCNAFDTIKTYTAAGFAKGLFIKERTVYNKNVMDSVKADTLRLALFNITNNTLLCGSGIFLAYRALTDAVTLGEVLVFLV
jgi:ABC-type multidrug transport system fused ATPase/permease subunit